MRQPRFIPLLLAVFLALTAGLFWGHPALAAGPVVNTAADNESDGCTVGHCTLREAIIAANVGETITFSTSYTIYLNSQLDISRTVTIDGQANAITVSGDSGGNGSPDVRVFNIQNTGVVTLNHLSIISGTANGGDNCPEGCGGGILNQGNLTVLNSTISGNTAFIGGGGMFNDSVSPILTNVTFSGNKATASGGYDNYGGGMLNFAITPGSTSNPTLLNVTFSGNTAGYGAGMSNYSYGDGTASSPTLTHVTFSGNQAEFSGGGIYNNSYSSDSSPTLANVTFSGNTAGVTGGGMTNESNLDTSSGRSSPTLIDVTFDNNSSGNWGGAMYNYSSGLASTSSPTLTNVTFSGNTATNGGGMYNFGVGDGESSPTLTNVTFSGNTATDGGGMINLGDINGISSPKLTNVTFNGNTASNSGGGVYNRSSSGGDSSPTIRNSIFWGDANGEIINSSGTPVISDSVVQGGYLSGTNIITDAPRLGVLGDYGGSTQTIPLLPGSSAIDTGDNAVCPTTDQRGMPRVKCDIGAFESRGFTLTYGGGSNQSTLINTAFTKPLTLIVTSVYTDEPVAGGQVIFTGPGSGASTHLAVYTATISGGSSLNSGQVTQVVTANNTVGSYVVTATVPGNLGSPVSYNLTNTLPIAQFSMASYSVNENGGAAVITVTLSGAAAFTTSVDLSSADNTAAALSDYAAVSRTLTFAPGATLITFTVNVTDDALYEGSEALTLTLGSPIIATLGLLNPATLTILDNDSPGVTVTPTNLTVSEPDGTAVFTLTLNSQPTAAVTVTLSSSDTTECTVASPVTLDTLNWQTGVSVTVTAVDDTLVDGDQPCAVNGLFSSSDSSYHNQTFTLAVTVMDDENPTLYLPLIFKNLASGPDLVIDRLTAGAGGPQVVIRNAGDAPITTSFWVDVYFNPSQTPSLNQPWKTIAPAGAVWGVTKSLSPGESLTLTVGGPYYFPTESNATFPAGAQVYGYVDSMNLLTSYGGVLETDEGNNLFGPITSTAAAGSPVAGATESPEGLPGR